MQACGNPEPVVIYKPNDENRLETQKTGKKPDSSPHHGQHEALSRSPARLLTVNQSDSGGFFNIIFHKVFCCIPQLYMLFFLRPVPGSGDGQGYSFFENTKLVDFK